MGLFSLTTRPCLRGFFWSWLLAAGFGDLGLSLRAQVPPSITVQPPPYTKVAYGGALSLGVTVAGDTPLRYQWWHDGHGQSHPARGHTPTVSRREFSCGSTSIELAANANWL